MAINSTVQTGLARPIAVLEGDPPAPADRNSDENQPILGISNLNVYYGEFHAVSDVSFEVPKHRITALIGPSGCGKSTVLRCINRMNDLIPSARVEGSITYHGVDICTPRSRSGRGSPPDRHGFPEAEPVSEEHLREHRLGGTDQRLSGRL